MDFNARIYDPALGRFMGADALASLTPAASPYAFVANDPVNFVDPTGYTGWPNSMEYMWSGIDTWADPSAEDGYAPFNNYGGGYGGGRIGPGSWADWSAEFNSPEVNLARMSTSAWRDFYGVDGMSDQEKAEFAKNSGLAKVNNELTAELLGGDYDVDAEGNLIFYGYVSSAEYSNYGNIRGATYVMAQVIQAAGGIGTTSGGWLNTAIDHAGKTVGGASIFNGGVTVVAREYVRQVTINNELAGIRNAKLPSIYNAAKSVGKRLAVVGGVIVIANVAYNSQVNASDLIGATMAGIAFTGWGTPIAGIWFVADFGMELITGSSLSDRIDSAIGAPLLEWDY